jgi:HAD superfamily hydrolase (TIGR01509 family)
MLKALIFDVDGTLADTEEIHRRAFNEAFKAHGLAWYWSRQQYARLLLVAGGKERLEHYVRGLSLSATEKAPLFAQIPSIHETKTRLYGQFVKDGTVPLRPGVARLIGEARDAGIALAIASTTTPTNVEALLRAALGAEALAWFVVLAAGDQVAHKKPAPDIFELALARLGCAAHECVAFEDSANGVAAACAAGLFTVATPNFWTQGQAFGDAHLVLEHLGDPESPLPAAEAARIGAPQLGLAQLERLHLAWQQAGTTERTV